MSPILKKALAALAIKEGFEKVQEMRNPKPSLWSRMTKPLTLLALGGGGYYLYKSGRLDTIVKQAKGLKGGDEPSTSSWDAPSTSNGATVAGSAPSTTS